MTLELNEDIFQYAYSDAPVTEVDFSDEIEVGGSTTFDIEVYHISSYFITYAGIYLDGIDKELIRKWVTDTKSCGLSVSVNGATAIRFGSSTGIPDGPITIFESSESMPYLLSNYKITLSFTLKVPPQEQHAYKPSFSIQTVYLKKATDA